MPEPENQQDPQGQSANATQGDPAGQPGGQSQQPLQAAQDDLPEKFKGKSAKDIANSYLELEKHTGKTSQEVKEARENLAQWEALGKVIQSNPALEKLITEEIEKIGGKKTEGDDSHQTDSNQDVRIATTDSIFKEFEREHGIDRLNGDSQTALQNKIGKELAEILDPTGSKPLNQLLSEVPLNRLGGHLRKAYKLATVDDEKERARLQGLLQAKQNRDAEFGSIPSSSGSPVNQAQLSAEELKVATRLNISPEKYLENKKKIALEA